MKKTLTIAALAMLAPTLALAADTVTNVKYACKDSKVLNVVYVNTSANSFAVIADMDELVPMKQVVTASGASYEAIDPNYSFRLDTKGKTATLSATNEGKEEVLFADCNA